MLPDDPRPPTDAPHAPSENERFLADSGVSLDRGSLLEALDHDDSLIRAAAAHVLGTRSDPSALPALRAALARAEDDLAVVETGAAIAKLGDRFGLEALHAQLAVPTDQGVGAPLAAGALAELGDNAGYDVVLAALRSDLLTVRLVASHQIAHFAALEGTRTPSGSDVDLERLAGLGLEDPAADVRSSTLAAVAELGTASSLRLLEMGAVSHDEQLAARARRILEDLDDSAGGTGGAP